MGNTVPDASVLTAAAKPAGTRRKAGSAAQKPAVKAKRATATARKAPTPAKGIEAAPKRTAATGKRTTAPAKRASVAIPSLPKPDSATVAPSKTDGLKGADSATQDGKRDGKAKPQKSTKDKLVRDGFTMPESEFKLIDAVKQRALSFKRVVKKSEVLRAGLKALQGLSETQLKALLETLPTVKTGRPKKGH